MSHAAGVNWIEVGSLCAGAGALVTAGLAVVTRNIAKKTNDVATQTQELVEVLASFAGFHNEG